MTFEELINSKMNVYHGDGSTSSASYRLILDGNNIVLNNNDMTAFMWSISNDGNSSAQPTDVIEEKTYLTYDYFGWG